MKTKHYILLTLGGLMAFFAGFFIGKDRTEKPPGTVTETKETTVDTIPYFAPMPKSELATGTHRYSLPIYRFFAERSIQGDGFFAGRSVQGDGFFAGRSVQGDGFFAGRSVQGDDYLGGGSGGEPRQRSDNDSVCVESVITAHYGTGAGGEPRCSTDSAIVELPMIQRHYADSAYEAWVSGPVDPRLDSVRVFVPTTIITKQEWKPPKRWHIGVTAGYGYGPKGFQPYIGVGVTYSIFSF